MVSQQVEDTMLGNGVVGILSETTNKWERRVPLTPSHCARLLHGGKGQTGVARIVVQPSTKRIYHDALYEDVGCEISEDLSECGLIVGVKQPKLEMIFPRRAYAFFSHTHKAQKENMILLDKADYYAHPEHYRSIFHETIGPYASVIVNCMYWERRFPRLLTTKQLQDLKKEGCPLIGISDITCDIEGSIEFVQTTSIDSPFLR